MAYNQKPGGPMKQKTGHGIPSALLQKPDYAREDERENAALNDFTSTNAAKGVSYTAGRMLDKFPAQKKHVIKNFQQDANGSSSYETKVNAREAVQAVQVGRDSIAHIGNEKDPAKREALGRQFHVAFSPYNKYNKREQDRSGKGYQGPDGISGTDKDRSDVLSNLRTEGILHGGYSNNQEVAEKVFGLKSFQTPTNPKAGTDKLKKMGYDAKGNKIKLAPKQMKPSSPVKQKQDLGKEPKSSGPEKSAKQIKEEKMSREPAPKQMKPKGSAAKMKKC